MKVNIPVRMKNPWFWVGIVAVLAVFVDPTTAGVTDSDRALSYRKPLEK